MEKQMPRVTVSENRMFKLKTDILNFFKLERPVGGRYRAYRIGGRPMTPFNEGSELEIWFARLADAQSAADYQNILTDGGKILVERLLSRDGMDHQKAVKKAKERFDSGRKVYRAVFAHEDGGYRFVGVFKIKSIDLQQKEWAYNIENEKVSDSFSYDGSIFEGVSGRAPTRKECFGVA